MSRLTQTPDGNDLDDEHKRILEEDSFSGLIKALLCCRGDSELRAFLADLCTPQEIATLSERLVIARLLASLPEEKKGLSYRDISALTGASTTTVGRVARFLQQEPHRGYQLVLERLTSHDNANTNKKKQPGS